MSKDLKTELSPKLRVRSARRSREGKSCILDRLCEDHGYEHKYASKVLRGTVPPASGRKHSSREPGDTLIEQVVRTIRPVAEQPCGNAGYQPSLKGFRPPARGCEKRVASGRCPTNWLQISVGGALFEHARQSTIRFLAQLDNPNFAFASAALSLALAHNHALDQLRA
ncbi:MAG: hypothetical protein KIS67_25730 [Verrucomicrobiae bacterium]|nr:hypothetical protein [Verrucomicrobiae bacterium]